MAQHPGSLIIRLRIKMMGGVIRLISAAILLFSMNSCVLIAEGVVLTSDTGTEVGHIKYVNRTLKTEKQIYQKYKIIDSDEVILLDGQEVQIIVASDLSFSNKKLKISSGKKLVNTEVPKLRTYIEFQLIDGKVKYWESYNLLYPQYPKLAFQALLLDLAVFAVFTSLTM